MKTLPVLGLALLGMILIIPCASAQPFVIEINRYDLAPTEIGPKDYARGFLTVTNAGDETWYGAWIVESGQNVPKTFFMRSTAEWKSYQVIRPGESRTFRWLNSFRATTPEGTYPLTYSFRLGTSGFGNLEVPLPEISLEKS